MARTSNPLTRGKAFHADAHALKHGFRSGLEGALAADLEARGVPFAFEEVTLPYTQPEKGRKYTPDFFLPRCGVFLPAAVERRDGIFIESKGRFLTEDRQKHIHVRNCNPGTDIRFVFSNANARISKQSATTYAMWADRSGFKWAHRSIPVEWLRELGYTIKDIP